MSKAGFECVHVPSIDVTSVLSPEALAANNASQRKAAGSLVQNGLNDSVSSGGHGVPSAPFNGMFPEAAYPWPTYKDLIMTGHQRNTQPSSVEEDFDAWAYSGSGGAGSALLVKFEISIVKVCSLLRLPSGSER